MSREIIFSFKTRFEWVVVVEKVVGDEKGSSMSRGRGRVLIRFLDIGYHRLIKNCMYVK